MCLNGDEVDEVHWVTVLTFRPLIVFWCTHRGRFTASEQALAVRLRGRVSVYLLQQSCTKMTV